MCAIAWLVCQNLVGVKKPKTRHAIGIAPSSAYWTTRR